MCEIIEPFSDFWASHRYIEVETQFGFQNQKTIDHVVFLASFPHHFTREIFFAIMGK